MTFILLIISAGLALAALGLAAFLTAEVLAALIPLREKKAGAAPGPITVIVPAHNEADVLRSSLANIQSQLREQDQLVVVADNCTDGTASVALDLGVEVMVRHDPDRRGKGYALQHGLDGLRAAPPALVVFADADCLFAEGALQHIAALAESEDRPVQALYLMKAPHEAGPRLQVAEFAWLFINQVRMLGLQRMFDVTRFTGSGFAVPWRRIEGVSLASAEIVEDLALGIQLTRAGAPPLLAPGALVESDFPTEERAQTRQAARWSIGSLRYAMRASFSLIVDAVNEKNLRLFGAALDLLIPPLTLFAAKQVAIAILCLSAWLITGASAPFMISFWALILTASAIILGWTWYGRVALPPSALGGVVAFLAAKANVFGRAGRASAKRWTPTRENDDAETRS